LSPERTGWIFARRLPLAIALAATVALQACTVRPLYMNAPASPNASLSTKDELSSILVKAVSSRDGQEMRNHLIFLLGNGQGQPAEPRYVLDVGVTRLVETAALIQVNTENEPTASTVTMRSAYRLFQADGKTLLAEGVRQVVSSYDVPRQEFAALRARRDAENRAARELAEAVRLAVAQDIARLPAQ